jgi:hypothetical protein
MGYRTDGLLMLESSLLHWDWLDFALFADAKVSFDWVSAADNTISISSIPFSWI